MARGHAVTCEWRVFYHVLQAQRGRVSPFVVTRSTPSSRLDQFWIDFNSIRSSWPRGVDQGTVCPYVAIVTGRIVQFVSILSLLGMALTIWQYPLKRSAGFYLVLVALGLLIATLLITLLVEVPIDNEIREWTVLTLPSDWEQTRLTWKRFHAFRTATSVGSLAALVLGILLSSERRRLAPHTVPAVV